jgi:hypothetical protein
VVCGYKMHQLSSKGGFSLMCVFYLTFENQFCGRELLKFIGIVPAAFMSRLQFYLIIKGGVFILIGIDAGARL